MKLHTTILGHPWVRSCVTTLIGLLPVWLRPREDHPFLWALVPVLITYGLSVLGMAWLDPPEVALSDKPDSPIVGMIPVLLITITHAVVPIFLIGVAFRGGELAQNRGCLYALIGIWFGWPILGLATHTGWLSLLPAAVHLALARRKERTWVFVEYGSISLSLLMFVTIIGNRLFPWGLVVVVAQSILLTLAAVWGRKLYDFDPPAGRDAAAPAEAASEDSSPAARTNKQSKRRGGKRRKRL